MTTRRIMVRNLIVLMVFLPCIASTRVRDRCESHHFTNSLHGRYCPTEGIVRPNLAWHQCKLFCLHTPSFQAVNYDFSASMCTYLVETCSQAKNHPGMAFGLFTGRQPHECLEWMPIGSFSKDHTVTNDNWRFAARLQKDGNNFGGFNFEVQNICCTDGDDGEPVRSDEGSPCQYLLVRDGCTVYSTGILHGLWNRFPCASQCREEWVHYHWGPYLSLWAQDHWVVYWILHSRVQQMGYLY